jgi:hypothetical protein
MSKIKTTYNKKFNPYDLNDVAELNNYEIQYLNRQKYYQGDKENKNNKNKCHQGLLKII